MTRVLAGDTVHMAQNFNGTKGDVVSMSDGSWDEINVAWDDRVCRVSLLLHEVLEIVCEATDDLFASALHRIGQGVISSGLLVGVDGETRVARG